MRMRHTNFIWSLLHLREQQFAEAELMESGLSEREAERTVYLRERLTGNHLPHVDVLEALGIGLPGDGTMFEHFYHPI
jgi:hypothetical protein